MFERLSEYLDKELDELTCREIEQHMDGCIPCKACMETLRRTVDLCRSLKREPVPPELSRRLKDLIRQLPSEV